MTPQKLATRHPAILKATLAAALFLLLEVALVLFIDRPLAASVRSLETSMPEVIGWFKSITDYGKSFWYLLPSGSGALLCLALVRLPKIGNSAQAKAWLAKAGIKLTAFFAVIALSGLLTDVLKWLIGRARPVLDQRSHIYAFLPFSADSTWNSMPSGHATTSIALAVALALLWPRGRIVWLALGGLLAASRVIVCAHYLSDILAGGLVATIVANELLHSRKNGGILPCVNRLFPSDKPVGAEAMPRSAEQGIEPGKSGKRGQNDGRGGSPPRPARKPPNDDNG